MPDKRRHRGPHPEDPQLFAAKYHPALRAAVADYSWLLGRGYAEDSALALVGNRYELTERQRFAVRRAACSNAAADRRRSTRVELAACRDRPLWIDGYNVLITIESALSGGLVLIGRDGCCRDLASIHGTYRRIDETEPAIRLIADHLQAVGVLAAIWYLDRPVSNSGKLAKMIAGLVAARPLRWRVELSDRPDSVLAQADGPVATSDSWILDRCSSWVNLAAEVIECRVPRAWRLDFPESG